jgi:hypothetical protein
MYQKGTLAKKIRLEGTGKKRVVRFADFWWEVCTQKATGLVVCIKSVLPPR